jgi:hypothetical protein
MRARSVATLLHEVGHFFGMTEDDLDRYEIGNRPRPDAARVRPLVDLREPVVDAPAAPRAALP